MFRSNLSNLVADAFRHGEASASDRKWQAFHFVGAGFPVRVSRHYNVNPEKKALFPWGAVGVWHYSTHMFNVTRDGQVIPVNPGWGSMTDRAGVRRITDGWGCSVGYRELYGEAS